MLYSAQMFFFFSSRRRHTRWTGDWSSDVLFRSLMPEYMQENLEYKHVGEEIHPSETSEEKVSLSERFGLWVSFYPFDQDDYLRIVGVWLDHYKAPGARSEAARNAALQWSLQRGSRSGRVAWQFARDWAGKARTR